MTKIESAYLNADQEQKLNNLINKAGEVARCYYRPNAIPPSFIYYLNGKKGEVENYATGRIVWDALPCYFELANLYEKGIANTHRIREVLHYFYKDVFAHELKQITDGTQEFVDERFEIL